MARLSPSSLYFSFQLCFSFLVAVTNGQDLNFTAVNGDTTFTSLNQAIPHLIELKSKPPIHNVSLGAQNFTRCCLLAVQQSFHWNVDGSISATPNSYTVHNETSKPYDIVDFLHAQFPCGAVNDIAFPYGAPLVAVGYDWCKSNCNGWEHASDADLSAWIVPFVGFILPAAVFCLNVPRKRGLAVFDSLFPNFLPKLIFKWNELAKLFKSKKPEEDARKQRITFSYGQSIREESSVLKWAGEVFVAFVDVFVFANILIVEMVIRTTIAVTIALLDTIIWVTVVFATATPMILSGLYEAALDRQVIDIMHGMIIDRKTIDSHRLESFIPVSPEDDYAPVQYMRHRVHLLYALLVGNLVMGDLKTKQNSIPEGNPQPLLLRKDTKYTEDADTEKQLFAYKDVEELVDFITDLPLPFAQTSGNAAAPQRVDETDKKGATTSSAEISPAVNAPRTFNTETELLRKAEVEKTRTRLNAMLDCQSGFGGAIGAPIVFFIGSFLVSVFSNLSNIGEHSSAFAISFGTWWITIPHVAIVGGCLLAGNNPNTLQAIMCAQNVPPKKFSPSLWRLWQGKRKTESIGDVLAKYWKEWREEGEEDFTGKRDRARNRALAWYSAKKTWGFLFAAVYESHYQPVWMWDRGRSKRDWIRQVQETEKYPTGEEGVKHHVIEDIGEDYGAKYNFRIPKTLGTLGNIEWFYITILAIGLIFYPFVLATLTSYWTPTLGLSCRSFTFVLYFIFQFWLGALWVIDFQRVDVNKRCKVFWQPKAGPFTKLWFPTWFGIALWFGFLVSIFTTLIGTFMQITGVYGNCLCNMPLSLWGRLNTDDGRNFRFQISNNSWQDIHYASKYWVSTGLAAIALLLIVTYGGWWYQRHWRAKFVKLIDLVLNAKPYYIKPSNNTQDATAVDGQTGEPESGAGAVGTEDSEAKEVKS